MTRHSVKRKLKEAGITHMRAARELGRSYEHLNRVLNGHRESRSLLARLAALIEAETKVQAGEGTR